ncbi:MAG: chromosome segregation protein SMC [Deltaproteobacteria bacterium]|nr:chromosome segregation protein SMC [Deltaproteobacteria bacterium]
MRIKRIELCGFKSFPDRTVLSFDSNVTAIVGPNGCGKSNIMDALRWAMGEQSAKALRGKQMDDVVFIGSDSRPTQSMAEATMTFSTDDGLVPVKYATYREIEVTRRMFRASGESQYFINKVPVRLRDVTDLFLGTGAGTRAYSLIEQGRIGYIVTARPQERRALIEEAAGITRYRVKRQATERQLAATEQNLLRIRDRLHDKEEQSATLRRQAQKAERFKAYRDEQRGIEVHLAAHEALAQFALVALLQRDHARITEELEGGRAELAAREAELAAERLVLDELERAVQDHQAAVWEITNRIQLAEASMRAARTEVGRLQEREQALAEQRTLNAVALERGTDELAAHRTARDGAALELDHGEERLAVLSGRLAARREECHALEDRLADARRTLVEVAGRAAQARAAHEAATTTHDERTRRLAALEERLVEARRRNAEIDAALDNARRAREGVQDAHEGAARDVARTVDDIERLRLALHDNDERLRERRMARDLAESRSASLREIVERHEAFGDGVRALLAATPDGSPPAFAPLGELVTCDDGYEAALAAVLGETLQRLICDERGAAADALARLRDGGLGRAAITPRQGWRPRAAAAGAEPPPGAVRLLDHVRLAPDADAPAREALADVLVVASLDEADRLRAGGGTATYVTRTGEVLLPDGTLCGGSAEDRFAPFLHARAELERRGRELPELEALHAEAEAEQESLRARLREAQDRQREVADRAHQLEIEAARCDGDLTAVGGEHVRVAEEIAALEGERAGLRAALAEGAATLERLATERDAAVAAGGALEQAAARLSGEVETARREQDAAGAEHAAERETAAAARARCEAAGALVESLERRLVDLARENEQADLEAERNAGAWGEARGRIARLALELEDLTAEHRQRADALAMAQASFEAQRSGILDREATVREGRERQTALAGRVAETRADVEAALREVRFLDERLAERHQTTLEEAIAAHHADPPADENARRRSEELRRLLERMGGVNLLAIEEYREAAATVEQLTRQKDDLEQAMADLRTAIAKMNRESRLRFRATFEAVNEQFQKLFPKMFRGGRAYLQLTESEDLLEAGVDIVAQPPGKRLQSIELLSGGEKALTAVSLVFALFLYKPSPFCVLDEVDAPLDDANVGRFCDLIHELADRTQFIVVTHIKQTMERAEVLYGVTMEEPGVSKIVTVRLREGAALAAPRNDVAVGAA